MKKACLGVALALLAGATVSAFEATVVSAKGKAEVLKGSDWQTLSAGATVSKGDVIQTGFKSEVILKIKESTVTVESLSRLTVEQLAEKSSQDSTRLFLDTGSLKSDVKKSENRRTDFTVRSPVATASVRGTIFAVETKFGTTDVTTHEGGVAFWKNPVGTKAELTSESEDAAEGTPSSGTGMSPQDIAPSSPRGAVTVAAGQTAAVAFATAAVAAPQQRAAENAAVTGAATNRAAQNEFMQMGAASAAPVAAEPMPAPAPVGTGTTKASIVITPVFPSEN